MRKLALISLLACVVAAPAFAAQQEGKIDSVDRAGKAFGIGTKFAINDATYKTTPRTVIMMGSAPTSFDAIKIGDTVQVDYHVDGTASVVDRVLIK